MEQRHGHKKDIRKEIRSRRNENVEVNMWVDKVL
jgi:hypothetical protein